MVMNQKIIIPLLVLTIILSSISFVSAQSDSIPSWIKNTAGYWVNDEINDAEFIQGIEFLINNEIIKIDQQKFNTQSQESCDELYYHVMHWSIIDAFYGKLAESAKTNSEYYTDKEDLLKASEELLKISKFNGLDDEDLEKFRLNCKDQLSEEQNLAVDYLEKWVDKFGF